MKLHSSENVVMRRKLIINIFNLLIWNITYHKLKIKGDDYFETTVEETGSLTFRSISQILIATNYGKFVITIKI
jgi:hypothetical protein